ncbi:BRCT domain-containing protein [Moritella viscosa]|uniref:BRCT domain-containing protein n=1 Tax=Moritella viscosa TaxID=80854 RepID=UPI0006982DA7|nr:BRCT domain-containing protein [Moritella viscosa]
MSNVTYDKTPHEAALNRFNQQANTDKCLEHLLGICTGLTADRYVSDDEIVFLHHWLCDNPIIEHIWPANQLLELTTDILNDQIIDEDERTKITTLLNQIIGSPTDNGVSSGMSTESPIDFDTDIKIPNNVFVFTGKFSFGSRKKCEEATVEREGKVGGKDVTFKTNYLVIGGTANDQWKFSSFGRKIQRAMDVRDDDRSNLKIISEEQWSNHL